MGCKCSRGRDLNFLTAADLSGLLKLMDDENQELSHEIDDLMNSQNREYSLINHYTQILTYGIEVYELLKTKTIDVKSEHFTKLKLYIENFYKNEKSDSTFELNNSYSELKTFIKTLRGK